MRIATLAASIVLLATPAFAWDIHAEMIVSAKVRYEPLPTAKVLDTLSAGDAVTILQCVPSGRWCLVRHPGRDGWVKAETFDRYPEIHQKYCHPGSTALLCTTY